MSQVKTLILSLWVLTHMTLFCAPLQAEGPIPMGSGVFPFRFEQNGADKVIDVWYHRPKRYSEQSPIIILIHGGNRNGRLVRDSWISFGDSKKALLVAPEFSALAFPSTRVFHRGNIFKKNGRKNDESDWTFTVIENLFDYIQIETENDAEGYYLFGYRGGAQFVHRMVLFKPQAKILSAVAAGGGWYTFPDFGIKYPYGLKNSGITENQLKASFEKELIIMVGELDRDKKDKGMNKTQRAMEQGATRVERAESFYDNAVINASKHGALFSWRFVKVPGVRGGRSKMSFFAGKEILR